MTKVKVHIDTKRYTKKPMSNNEFGIIKLRLQTDNTIQEIELEDLITKIEQGYTISPSIVKGGRTADCWYEQTLFMVDIDNNDENNILSIKDALSICKSNNVIPIFYYYTFHHTKKLPRYRLAFLMDKTITDTNIREKIILTLISLFPHSDIKCKSAESIFLGTNSKAVIYDLNATISLETINGIALSTNIKKNKLYDFSSANHIPIGNRNNALFIKACKLSEQGLDYNTVLASIQNENNDKCETPLPNKEIETLVKSAFKHVNNLPPYIKRYIKNDNVHYTILTPILAQYIRETQNYFLVKNNANDHIMIFWYEDGVYKNINEDMLKGYIKAIIQSFDLNLYKSSIVNETYKDLTTDLKFIRQDELNNVENIINFKNGLYDIETKQLIPHTPKIINTIQIPCDWNDNEIDAPIFLSYIDRLTDNREDLKSLLLQFMGACFSNIKGYRFKKALFLVGDGNTGKSVLKTLTEKILGKDNYTGIDLPELEERFGTSMLYNKRLAGSSDMSFVSIKELKQFKKLTGGDSIFTEYKGRNGFDQIYNGLLWFCCNKLPKFSGDNGQWVYDRIIVINCTNVIPKEEQDKFLLDKMYDERESIVKLAINELQKARDNNYNFVISKEINKETILYQQSNNTVYSFIRDCCTERKTFKDGCTCKKLYDIYVAYCKDNNNGYAKTNQEFKQELMNITGLNENNLIKRTNKNIFYIPYTITLDTYISYYNVYGYCKFFEDKKMSNTN